PPRADLVGRDAEEGRAAGQGAGVEDFQRGLARRDELDLGGLAALLHAVLRPTRLAAGLGGQRELPALGIRRQPQAERVTKAIRAERREAIRRLPREG